MALSQHFLGFAHINHSFKPEPSPATSLQLSPDFLPSFLDIIQPPQNIPLLSSAVPASFLRCQHVQPWKLPAGKRTRRLSWSRSRARPAVRQRRTATASTLPDSPWVGTSSATDAPNEPASRQPASRLSTSWPSAVWVATNPSTSARGLAWSWSFVWAERW
jgi:hypothetical protein